MNRFNTIFTISNYRSGTLSIKINDQVGILRNSNGIYSEVFLISYDHKRPEISFISSLDFVGSIEL